MSVIRDAEKAVPVQGAVRGAGADLEAAILWSQGLPGGHEREVRHRGQALLLASRSALGGPQIPRMTAHARPF